MFSRTHAALGLVSSFLLCGCSNSNHATGVMMNFDRKAGFYGAPFPSDDLRTADGTVDLSLFPNVRSNALVTDALGLASSAGGFACSAGVFFQTTSALDPATLPSLKDSTSEGATVFLLGIDPTSPDYLRRHTVEVNFEPTASPYGAPNLLALVPLQGIPLRPNTRYAAVVTTAVKDSSGASLGSSPEVAALAGGHAVSGMPASALPSYTAAIDALAKAGIKTSDVAGLSAFTTGDPTSEAMLFRQAILALPMPEPDAPFVQQNIYDDYCVYLSTIPMPDYQSGTPPFLYSGGGWEVDSSGNPILQRNEEARIFVTVPRAPIPDSGFPIVLFIRTGAGGDRPLVDRGTQGEDGGELVPGTGPALFFAQVGFAGASVDGPLGGIRNTTDANEDFTIFNISNPIALRDNLRQSAIELALQAHILPTISFDVSDCPGAIQSDGGTAVSFDATHLAIMGHSMGSTILPLAGAMEPAFKTAILSGAGSSWIENILYKELPLVVAPLMEILLGYHVGTGPQLSEYDPVLSLFQWAIESSDPQVYDSMMTDAPVEDAGPRQILMFQGIVDHYILPDIANATTLTFGLDLGGTELDMSTQEPQGQTLVSAVLPLVGHGSTSLPASGNLTLPNGTQATGVLIQAPGDAIEDGHEVVFQTDGPKHQYQCFLASTLVNDGGLGTVPQVAGLDASCQ